MADVDPTLPVPPAPDLSAEADEALAAANTALGEVPAGVVTAAEPVTSDASAIATDAAPVEDATAAAKAAAAEAQKAAHKAKIAVRKTKPLLVWRAIPYILAAVAGIVSLWLAWSGSSVFGTTARGLDGMSLMSRENAQWVVGLMLFFIACIALAVLAAVLRNRGWAIIAGIFGIMVAVFALLVGLAYGLLPVVFGNATFRIGPLVMTVAGAGLLAASLWLLKRPHRKVQHWGAAAPAL